MNLGQYAREVERIIGKPVEKVDRVDSELVLVEECVEKVKEVLK